MYRVWEACRDLGAGLRRVAAGVVVEVDIDVDVVVVVCSLPYSERGKFVVPCV